MRGHGHEPYPVWKQLPLDPDDRKNAPDAVLREIGTILAAALGTAFVVNLLLLTFGIG